MDKWLSHRLFNWYYERLISIGVTFYMVVKQVTGSTGVVAIYG